MPTGKTARKQGTKSRQCSAIGSIAGFGDTADCELDAGHRHEHAGFDRHGDYFIWRDGEAATRSDDRIELFITWFRDEIEGPAPYEPVGDRDWGRVRDKLLSMFVVTARRDARVVQRVRELAFREHGYPPSADDWTKLVALIESAR